MIDQIAKSGKDQLLQERTKIDDNTLGIALMDETVIAGAPSRDKAILETTTMVDRTIMAGANRAPKIDVAFAEES